MQGAREGGEGVGGRGRAGAGWGAGGGGAAVDAGVYESFWRKDRVGKRGGLVRGFLSGSRSAAVLQAAGRRVVLLEVNVGKAAGAVDLAWVSQYPHLGEVVLAPYTHLDILPHYQAVPAESLDEAARRGHPAGASAPPRKLLAHERSFVTVVEASAARWQGVVATGGGMSARAAWPVRASAALALPMTHLARRLVAGVRAARRSNAGLQRVPSDVLTRIPSADPALPEGGAATGGAGGGQGGRAGARRQRGRPAGVPAS